MPATPESKERPCVRARHRALSRHRARNHRGSFMVNPLGLEDWQAEGVPFAGVDRNYRTELTTASAECFHLDRPDHAARRRQETACHPRARDPLRDLNHGAIVGAPVPPWVVAASVALEKSPMR
jgi:hypothetical protein